MEAKIPETMRAVILEGPDSFGIGDLPVPRPEPDEVLCRVMAVAICGSDPKLIRGDSRPQWPPSYPFVIGHEWSGVVVARGTGVIGLEPGDRVAGEAHCGCGTCGKCMQGKYTLCENYGNRAAGHRHYGHLTTGAYAQYAVFSRKAVTKMPASVSHAEGSLVDTAGTSLQVCRLAGVTPGGTSVVIGPGPIGILAGRIAKAMGAARVIMVGRGQRLSLSRELGADFVVDFEKEDPVTAVRNLTGGNGADHVYECSGSPGTLRQGIEMVKRGGTVGLVGIPPKGAMEEVPYRSIVLDQIGIIGSRANPNASAAVLAMIEAGTLAVKDLITHTFPMERFADGLDCFVNRKEGAMKVVILPNGEGTR